MKLFLDANAHVPLSKAALDAQNDFLKSDAYHGHPSSPSAIGRDAAKALEESRNKIAKLIGAEGAKNIIFTNSCTQACEWGMYMLSKTPGLCYISPIEHPAVAQGCESALGLIYGKLSVTTDGMVYIPTDKPTIGSISCIHMQNEIGTIQNISSFKDYYPDVKIFSDISQSLGKIPVNVSNMKVDFASAGAHKFGGPDGIGFLYVKDLDDWIHFGSGSRYFMDIPGTPNVLGAVMMAAALENAIKTLEERTHNMFLFRNELEPALEEMGFEIIGKNGDRCPNTTFVKAPCNALELLLELGSNRIHCGLGSACGSLYAGGSPLMRALGRDSNAQEYMRFSQWGEYSEYSARHVIDKIKKILSSIS